MPCGIRFKSNVKLLSVVDGVHVLDQLQNLVGVADLVKSRIPRLQGSEKKQQTRMKHGYARCSTNESKDFLGVRTALYIVHSLGHLLKDQDGTSFTNCPNP